MQEGRRHRRPSCVCARRRQKLPGQNLHGGENDFRAATTAATAPFTTHRTQDPQHLPCSPPCPAAREPDPQ